MAKKPEKSRNRWFVAILILVILGFFSFSASLVIGAFISSDSIIDGNIALIQIRGPITVDAGGLYQEFASSSDIVQLIDQADENDNIKAIILDINSPGGSSVASQEIADAIANVNKTTVAWIREVGASGAYWIASATDHIIANPTSITGSIGVIGSYLDFSEFIEDHNVSYQRLVSGKYKDMGSPFRKLSSEEEELFQFKLDKIREYFVLAVAKNRNLPEENVEQLATGMFYLGSEALEYNLIDKLGSKNEAIDYIESTNDIEAKISVFEKEKSFMDVLGEILFNKGFSINLDNGVSIKT